MPNVVAYGALAIWPIAAMLLFAVLSPVRGLIAAVIAAYLLLPVGVALKLPSVPALNKDTLSNLTVLVGCLIFARGRWHLFPRDPGVMVLLAVFVLSPFLTVIGNHEPLTGSDGVIPGLGLYDGLSAAVVNALTAVPFLLGYGLIRTPAQRLLLLRALVVAALAYSIPMLVEVRLSPQLHRWVYGFMPSAFNQQVRQGGYRPVVFLGHGLLVATFCAMALLAAIGLARHRARVLGMSVRAAAVALGVLLIICKAAGALALAILLGTGTALLRPRRLALLCSWLMLLVAIYPLPRSQGWAPLDTINRVTSSMSSARGGSFQYRVNNENVLLAWAQRKPLFGWGTWGRNRPSRQEAGFDVVTDGTWIITIGSWGWVGYVAMFGLLAAPGLKILRYRRRLGSITIGDATLAAILALNLLDLIPNSSLRPITWLIAGSLCGVTAIGARRQRIGARSVEEPVPALAPQLAGAA